MPLRFLIAPDPGRPGRFYAQDFDTLVRFEVSGPRPSPAELHLGAINAQLSLFVSEPDATLDDVEHPDPADVDQELFTRLEADFAATPVCVAPGCTTPAPLLCDEHRHVLTAADI